MRSPPLQTQGSLQEVPLASLLQSLQSERATGTLTLETGSTTCSLYFLFGHLFHASDATDQGEEVVVNALAFTEGVFQFDPRAKLPAEETIKVSPADLIALAEQRGGVVVTPPTEPEAVAEAEATTWESAPIEAAVDYPAPEPAVAAVDIPVTPPYADWATDQGGAVEAPSYASWQTEAAPETQPDDSWAKAPEPAATESPALETMYPLPDGKTTYKGLKSAFVDFPKLLRTLKGDNHTGYVYLKGEGFVGTLVFQAGELIEALADSEGRVTQGAEAFQLVRHQMEAGAGHLDVVDINGDLVASLGQLFGATQMFKGLLGRFVNFDALIEYLTEKKVTGSVVITHSTEMGVILLHDGAVLGAYTETARKPQTELATVGKLAAERASHIEVRSGTEVVNRIDVDLELAKPL